MSCSEKLCVALAVTPSIRPLFTPVSPDTETEGNGDEKKKREWEGMEEGRVEEGFYEKAVKTQD